MIMENVACVLLAATAEIGIISAAAAAGCPSGDVRFIISPNPNPIAVGPTGGVTAVVLTLLVVAVLLLLVVLGLGVVPEEAAARERGGGGGRVISSVMERESMELGFRKVLGVQGGVSVPVGAPPKIGAPTSRAIGVGARDVVGVGSGPIAGAAGVFTPGTL